MDPVAAKYIGAGLAAIGTGEEQGRRFRRGGVRETVQERQQHRTHLQTR